MAMGNMIDRWMDVELVLVSLNWVVNGYRAQLRKTNKSDRADSSAWVFSDSLGLTMCMCVCVV